MGVAETPSTLISFSDLEYQGAFRLPESTFGESSFNYSEGPIEYNSLSHSLFIVGHSHHQAIAEFGVPALVQSADISSLNMANAPLQGFSTVLERASGGNPQNLNRIGGMEFVESPDGPEIMVNAYEYYDAPGDNTLTTLVLREPDDLANSVFDGAFRFSGGAGHTSGWISPIPVE